MKTNKKFEDDFNLSVLKICIEDNQILKSLINILNVKHFPNKYLRKIFNYTCDFYKKYNSQITYKILLNYIYNDFPESAKIPYVELLAELESLKIESKQFILDSIVEYLTVNTIEEKLEETKALLEAGDWVNAELVFDNFKSSKHGSKVLTSINSGNTIQLGANKNKNEVKDQVLKYTKTIWPSLNKNFKDGLGIPGKNLVIIQAPSNYGKTRTLIANIVEALRQGRKCFFVTCELSADDIDEILCSLLTEEEIELYKNSILIIEIKASNCFINEAENKILSHIEDFFKPDLIAFDSIGNIKVNPDLRRDLNLITDNLKFEYIAERTRDLAIKFDLIFMTVWQTNRAGLREVALDESFVSKAIEIFQISDVYIVASQSLNQPEGQYYISLIKNRLGPKPVYIIQNWEPGKCLATEIEIVTKLQIFSENKPQKKKGIDFK